MALVRGNIVDDADFNALFTRLNAIRVNHLNKNGQASAANTALSTPFATNVAVPGATVIPANVQQIKNNLATLAQSVWIDNAFSAEIPIPSSGTLLDAARFTTIDNVITAVEAICPNYSKYSQYSQYTDYQYAYGDGWWL